MYNDKKMRAFEYLVLITLIISLKLGSAKVSEYAELALYLTYSLNLFFAIIMQIRLSYGSVRKRYSSLVEGDLSPHFNKETKILHHVLYLIATVVIIMFFSKVLQSTDLANLKLFNFLIFIVIGRTIKDVSYKYNKEKNIEKENE